MQPLPLPHHQNPLNHLHTAKTLHHLKQIHAQTLKHSSSLPTPFFSKLLPLAPLPYALSCLLHYHPSPPSPSLFALLLRSLARGRRREGRAVHGWAVKVGVGGDLFVGTGLVRWYGRCGGVEEARRVFERMRRRDLVAWGVMMDCYCQSGRYEDVLLLFEDMKDNHVKPDQVVLASVLSACARTQNLSCGSAVHSFILFNNIEIDDRLQSSLINMYSSCGSMDLAQGLYDELRNPKNLVASTSMLFGYAKIGKIDVARSIFNSMVEKDLVSWSAMISGYAESERPNKALILFNEMVQSGIIPDRIVMLSVISACGHVGALDHAKWVDIFVGKNGFRNHTSIGNALIDMYSKCGSLDSAWMIFEQMTRRNVISWTSMITSLAMHGDGEAALRLFERMKTKGVEPNAVTFISLLYACAHAGLVDQGRSILKSMVYDHNIKPTVEHYGCMVDLLGRSKLLNEALELVQRMPMRPNVIVWGSLLGAAKIHGIIDIGEFAAKQLLELDPSHDGAHILLSNIYAKANRWEDVGEVRRQMKSKGLLKEKGSSWIELDGQIHEFAMGEDFHPRSAEIFKKLNEVVEKLRVAGYVPNINSVLVDLEEEEKREAILLHSEKLALSFGLICTEKGSQIRIAKNLRVCEDCHSFMKFASQVFCREIILRDRTRFHHFRDGICSCQEFW